MNKFNKLLFTGSLLFAGSANALVITQNNNANDLIGALVSSGITVTSASLSGQSNGNAVSSGTYTNADNTYVIGNGIVLSTGNVSDYGSEANNYKDNTTDYGTSATVAQEAMLDPITGGAYDHYDVTQLNLVFDADARTNNIFLMWCSVVKSFRNSWAQNT